VARAQAAVIEAQAAAGAAAQQEAADQADVKKQAEKQAAAKKASAQAEQRAASESKVAREAAAKETTANRTVAAKEASVANNARAASEKALQDQLMAQVAEAQAAQAEAKAKLAILADTADVGTKREAEVAAEKKSEAVKALDLSSDAAPAKPNKADSFKRAADKSEVQASAHTRGGAAVAGKIVAIAEPLAAVRIRSFFLAGIAFSLLAAALRASSRRTMPQMATFPNLG